MIIKLVRHGESLSNIGKVKPHEVGDFRIPLTEGGKQQAFDAGVSIGAEFIRSSLVYCSPYLRTRETVNGILRGAGVTGVSEGADGMEGVAPVKVYEDPRLREVERGYAPEMPQRGPWKKHGWFYYRHEGGESSADCHDRTSAFLESFMRQAERHSAKSALIVTHGMVIRCFVMRFLHLTVEQFESMVNPDNCDVITIAPFDAIIKPVFSSGRWAVHGLALR